MRARWNSIIEIQENGTASIVLWFKRSVGDHSPTRRAISACDPEDDEKLLAALARSPIRAGYCRDHNIGEFVFLNMHSVTRRPATTAAIKQRTRKDQRDALWQLAPGAEQLAPRRSDAQSRWRRERQIDKEKPRRNERDRNENHHSAKPAVRSRCRAPPLLQRAGQRNLPPRARHNWRDIMIGPRCGRREPLRD